MGRPKKNSNTTGGENPPVIKEDQEVLKDTIDPVVPTENLEQDLDIKDEKIQDQEDQENIQADQESKQEPSEKNKPDSYISLVRIMKADKSIIEKGAELYVLPEKLQDWLKRGLIEKK